MLYFLMFLFNALMLFLLMQVTWGHDLLFINLINYCSTYFKFVKVKIHELQAIVENRHSNNDEMVHRKIVEIVKAHGTAIHLSEKLNESTKLMSFINVFINTVMVCFLIFVFGNVSDLDDLLCGRFFLGFFPSHFLVDAKSRFGC